MALYRQGSSLLRFAGGGLLSSGSGGSSEVTPVLYASRTSGPAPLAVYFDGLATTAVDVSDPWRNLGYYFDFDDTGAGTWTNNGRSKNTEYGGPIAGHVFETPGTYEVLMSARRSDGEWAQDSIEITVTDPDTVFSGTNTICISTDTNTTGAPAGATLLTNQTSWPTWQSNRRYLIRAGRDYESFGGIDVPRGVSNVQIAAFGSGADPIVASATAASSGPYSDFGLAYPENVVFSDLDCTGIVAGTGPYRNVLWLRCKWNGTAEPGEGIQFAYDAGYNATSGNDQLFWPECIFFVDCGPSVAGENAGLYGHGIGYMVMGHTAPRGPQHTMRPYNMRKSLIAHCDFTTFGGNLVIKMQGIGTNFSDFGRYLHQDSGGDPYAYYNIIRANQIRDDDNDGIWAIAVAPENDEIGSGAQLVRDIITEGNTYHGSWISSYVRAGNRLTRRGDGGAGYNAAANASNFNVRLPGGAGGANDGPYYDDEAAITTQPPSR